MTIMGELLLVAHKHISQFTPDEYRDYVKSLRDVYKTEQETKKEKRKLALVKKSTSVIEGINYRVNAKGTAIITCRRKPKWISPQEIEVLARHHGTKLNFMWMLIRDKDITIIKDKKK